MTQDYKCPYTSFKKDCSSIRNGCPKWIHITGMDPNTGLPVDVFDCADRWIIKMNMEVAKEVRQGAAATENFRNIMVRIASGEDPRLIPIKDLKLVNGS